MIEGILVYAIVVAGDLLGAMRVFYKESLEFFLKRNMPVLVL